jgi:hypothetical protein
LIYHVASGDTEKKYRHFLQFDGRHAVVQETNILGTERCSVSIADVKRHQSLPASMLQKLSAAAIEPAAEAAASPVVAADSNATTPSAAKSTNQSSKRRATATTSNGAASTRRGAAAKRSVRPTNTPVSQQSHNEAAVEHTTPDLVVAVPLDGAQVSMRTVLMTSQLV